MAIEGLVRVNVKFCEDFLNRVFDSKKRTIIPSELREIYKFRQEKDDLTKCGTYAIPGEYPVVAILTDNNPGKDLKYIFRRFDKQGRINLTSETVSFKIPEDNKVDFYSKEDYIEVRASIARENQSSSTE